MNTNKPDIGESSAADIALCDDGMSGGRGKTGRSVESPRIEDSSFVSGLPIMLTGAEMIVRALREQGVRHLFGYPGGSVLPIYDALFGQESIRHILVRHEQGAVHAAEGYARSTGKVGVVLVTSGPGCAQHAENLIIHNHPVLSGI